MSTTIAIIDGLYAVINPQIMVKDMKKLKKIEKSLNTQAFLNIKRYILFDI